MVRSKRCKECGGYSQGMAGHSAVDSIQHTEACSRYPSGGQRMQARWAEEDRCRALAHETVAALTKAGFTAEVRFGDVSMPADDAARLVAALAPKGAE